MAVIAAAGLTKYYGKTRGIEDLTFSVDEGEVFGFLGPNGAGKTTTIRTSSTSSVRRGAASRSSDSTRDATGRGSTHGSGTCPASSPCTNA